MTDKVAARSPISPPPGSALIDETELLPWTPAPSRDDVDDCALLLDTERGTCEGEGMPGRGAREDSSEEPEGGSVGRQTLPLSRVTAAEEDSCRENRTGS